MGAMLIGCLVSGPMFGISVIQWFYYIYGIFCLAVGSVFMILVDCPDTRKDPALLKYLVCSLFSPHRHKVTVLGKVTFIVFLDAFHYALITHSCK